MLEQRKLCEAAGTMHHSEHDQNHIIRNNAATTVDEMIQNRGRVQNHIGIDAAAIRYGNLRDAHCRLNAKIIRNANSLNASSSSSITSNHHGSSIRKTNEWADSILKDLDNLILSNQRYTASLCNPITAIPDQTANATATINSTGPPKSPQKRSTIINVVLRKTTPSTSPTSPTAPTAFASSPAITATTNLNKNQTAIITAAAPTKDNNKIPKPEKHVS